MTSWTTSKRCPGMGSMVMIVAVSLLTSPPMVEAWSPLSIRPTAVATGSMSSREDFLKQSVSAAVMASFVLSGNVPAARAINYYEESGSTATAEASIPVAKVGEIVNLANGVTYEVKQAGTGPKPLVGELAAIRFSAYCGTNKIDDVFDTPEPYYTRVGSGALLKGVEATIPLMRVGDRWTLTIPGELAFGKKGRPASAGKPRIPSDATIIFDIAMVGLPGREEELIELIGDY